jgi:hypothetical protein
MQINSSTTPSPYAANADTPAPRVAGTTTDTITTTDNDAGTDNTSTTTADQSSSSIKEFAYGALGLERPDTQSADTNQFYTAGKWVAAAATIGSIVSLFV